MFRRHRLFLHTVYCIVAEPPRPIFLSAGGLCTVLGSHAQDRTWGLMGGNHTAPPSCCKHETQGVLAEPASGAECECNGEMLPSYLPVSNGERRIAFSFCRYSSPPATVGGAFIIIASAADVDLVNLANLASIHFSSLGQEILKQRSMPRPAAAAAAAPFCAGFETEETTTQKTCSARPPSAEIASCDCHQSVYFGHSSGSCPWLTEYSARGRTRHRAEKSKILPARVSRPRPIATVLC